MIISRKLNIYSMKNLKKLSSGKSIQRKYTLETPDPFDDIAFQFTKKPLTEDLVNFREGKTGTWVTLNRPKALNSINLEMVSTLLDNYTNIAKTHSTDRVFLTAAGTRAFCAGGDIKALYGKGKGTESDRSTFFEKEYALNYLISTLDIPHVSIINGITMGGGAGLSVHGNIRIATEDTIFAMPEASIGFFCDVGGTYFLPRLPNHIGTYLGLTGESLKGYDVKTAGIATHFVLKEHLPQLLHFLSVSPMNTVKDFHDIIDIYERLSIETMGPKDDFNKLYGRTINHVFAKENAEDIIESLKKVKLSFAQKAIQSIMKNSPTSVKVIHESLKRGSKMSLKECLNMEFDMSQNFMAKDDFYLGVGAMVRREKKPIEWTPKSLKEVSNDLVQSHFQKSKKQMADRGADRKTRGRGGRRGRGRGGRGRGGREGKGEESDKWVPCTKLGRLVKEGKIKSLEEIYVHSIAVKEYQIIDYFLEGKLKDEVMKVMPVQKQTRAGQRTRFKVFIIVGDHDGHVGLGVKCAKEVATAIRGAIIAAKLSLVPVRRGFWGNKIGNPHTVPGKVTGKCGSIRVRLVPAPRGTGIVAAHVPKKILQYAGFEDVYTSSRGHTRTLGNFVKATFDAIRKTYGYLTPDLWAENVLTLSPYQEHSQFLQKIKH